MLNYTLTFMCLTIDLKSNGLGVSSADGALLCADAASCLCYAPGQRVCQRDDQKCLETILAHVRERRRYD